MEMSTQFSLKLRNCVVIDILGQFGRSLNSFLPLALSSVKLSFATAFFEPELRRELPIEPQPDDTESSELVSCREAVPGLRRRIFAMDPWSFTLLTSSSIPAGLFSPAIGKRGEGGFSVFFLMCGSSLMGGK